MWPEMSTIETTGIHGKLLFKDISEWHYDNDSEWVTNKKMLEICFENQTFVLWLWVMLYKFRSKYAYWILYYYKEFNIIKATPTKAQAQSSTCLGLHNSVGPWHTVQCILVGKKYNKKWH